MKRSGVAQCVSVVPYETKWLYHTDRKFVGLNSFRDCLEYSRHSRSELNCDTVCNQAAVGPIFNGHRLTIEDETHSGSRNVVGKLILHTVLKPQNRESVFITR